MALIDNYNWRCFLALEEELINTQNYVDFHKNNYNTFSVKYRSIIMQACSEIEVICKNICGISPSDKSKDMAHYGKYIEYHHGGFFTIVIEIPIYNEKIQPWTRSQNHPSPIFWDAYNEIKHQGKLESATLENAINALAGLFSLLLAWYVKSNGQRFSSNENICLPRLFSYPGLGVAPLVQASSNNIKISGF